MVKFLENSMVTQEVFSYDDIAILMKHPVVKALLSKLILINKECTKDGFWDETLFNKDEEILIAHSVSLNRVKVWSKW